MHQSEWRRERFGDFFDIRSGVGFKYEEYVESGIPLVKIDNVSHGFIKWENRSYLPESYVNDFPEIVLEEGDILLALNRPITRGQLKIARISASDLPAILYQRVGKIIALTQQTLPDFYYYLFDRLIFRFVSRKSIGSDQPFISITDLKKEPIPLPSVTEQKKIAQILSTWDQAITVTERLLENSRQRKKGLMQQLLTGKKRLPGFEGEWEAKPISQTGKIISGGTPDTNDNDLWNGNVQWLTPTDITALKTHFIYETPRKITDKGVKESSATLMPVGSLCICTRASVGLMAISTTPITTNQGFKSVVPNTKHDVEFLYYLFSLYRHVFIRYSSGSTFMELSKKDFAKITFNYPPLAEQEAIASVLASASDEIEQLEKRIACLKQGKQALMQQLLTGKLRVKAEADAA